MEKRKLRTIAFDFDGVINKYDGFFKGDEHVGKPIPEVIKAIKVLKKSGYKILIHSTRSNGVLKKYCKKYKIPVDYFNKNPEYKTGNPGKPVAWVYVDDRALLYKGQKAEKLVGQIINFKTYWKKKQLKG